jgi:hypothetical protein
MPTESNPSLIYDQATVDNIVDRIMKADYVKERLRVSQVEAWNLGFRDSNSVRNYVRARWFKTGQGLTVRTGNLADKIGRARLGTLYKNFKSFAPREHDQAVWEVTRNYTTLCHISGPGGTDGRMSMLTQQAFLLWGWMIDDLRSADQLELRHVGLGGVEEAALRNAFIIDELKNRRVRLISEIERHQKALRDLDVRLEGTLALTLDARLAG